jgi:hypothetical protein
MSFLFRPEQLAACDAAADILYIAIDVSPKLAQPAA